MESFRSGCTSGLQVPREKIRLAWNEWPVYILKLFVIILVL